MAIHELKTREIYWDAVKAGKKLFEVRKNDRFYQAGDIVVLLKWSPDSTPAGYITKSGAMTGLAHMAAGLSFTVGPVLQGGQFGIEPGYCVFSLLPANTQQQGAQS